MTAPSSTGETIVAPTSDIGLADVIAALAGIDEVSPLTAARARRHDATKHAQGSFEALFVPASADHVTLPERAAVALFVAQLHKQPAAVEFYGALLRETGGGAGLEPLIVSEAARAAGHGPYGQFLAENAPESVDGPEYEVASVEAAYALGDRLAAALEHAHLLVLHPRDTGRAPLGALLEAGWSTTGIVSLSQLVSFLTFQLRVAHGLAVVAGATSEPRGLAELARDVAVAARARLGSDGQQAAPAADQLAAEPRVVQPQRFTSASLGWKPWLEPEAAADFTDAQREALIEPERIHMPYFRLLARDPEALRERTLTDLDIFHNPDAGLARAERELAAAVASRYNGCVFCASVHSRLAKELGGRDAEVQRVLDEGVASYALEPGSASVAAPDRGFGAEREAVFAAAVRLTQTPSAFGAGDAAALESAGFDEAAVLDVIQASAFFNWANRLMLSLGEPTE